MNVTGNTYIKVSNMALVLNETQIRDKGLRGMKAGTKYRIIVRCVSGGSRGNIVEVPDKEEAISFNPDTRKDLIEMGLINDITPMYYIPEGCGIVVDMMGCKHHCSSCNGKCDYWEKVE